MQLLDVLFLQEFSGEHCFFSRPLSAAGAFRYPLEVGEPSVADLLKTTRAIKKEANTMKIKERIKRLENNNHLLSICWVIVILLSFGGALTLTQAGEPQSLSEQVMEQSARVNEMLEQYKSQQKKILDLIDEYKRLKKTTKNTENLNERTQLVYEQKLKKVIDAILEIYPETANEWDVYGVSIDVDIEYVERIIKVQKKIDEINLKQETDKLLELGQKMSAQHKERVKEREILQQESKKKLQELEQLLKLMEQSQSENPSEK